MLRRVRAVNGINTMTSENHTEAANKARKVRFVVDDGEIEGYAPEPSFDVHYPGDARKINVLQSNPLVPVGAGLTAAVLLGGLFAFNKGSILWSQRMMRARVLAQGATLALFARSVYAVHAEPDNKPEAPDSTPLPN